jgi:sugar lactone lactonase YvrE
VNVQSNQLEIIAEDNNRCGEGPIWDAEQQRLIWTDIESALVYQYLPATKEKSIISTGLSVSSIALNKFGELIFGGSGGLHIWRGQSDYQTVISGFAGENLFFNDMIADTKGRLYAGTLNWGPNGMERFGKLYLIDSYAFVRVMDENIGICNGLGFSPDGCTLYFTDSAAREIYYYDVDPNSGALSNKRRFARVPLEDGLPDGLTVDSQGFVWSARWYGGEVVRYDPAGKIERRIKLPVSQVSSMAFGGKDLNELYITTAGQLWRGPLVPPGFNLEATNVGGSMYKMSLDIQGKLENKAKFFWRRKR